MVPNQGAFGILITLLEVHYQCERAPTVIKEATGMENKNNKTNVAGLNNSCDWQANVQL